MTMIQALNSAMGVMLGPRPGTCSSSARRRLFRRGSSAPPEGLQKKYGVTRCFDTPIGEAASVRSPRQNGRLWLAAVVEIQVRRLYLPGLRPDRLQAARLRYRSAGDFIAPLTIPRPTAAASSAARPTADPEALFTHWAGLVTVNPSNPYDAKGLLMQPIESDDPVIFLEPKRLL